MTPTEIYVPSDIREFGERHKIPEFANATYRNGYVAGWRAALSQAEPAALAGLNYVIQYRRKSGGIRWINMAAFDSESVAERYCQDLQTADKPWQYRMMPLAPAQAEPADVAGLIENAISLAMGWEPSEAGPSYAETRKKVQGLITEALRALSAPAMSGTGEAVPTEWCQPDYEGKIHPRKFIVRFEDADVGDAFFDDEAEAYAFFERAEWNWNCYLFGLMPRKRGASPPAVEAVRVKTLWREIALSKAVKHDHPDISTEKTYLIKNDGKWYFGRFARQWYGLNFENWGTSGCQFDAPGWNSSKWERVIELDPEGLVASPASPRMIPTEQEMNQAFYVDVCRAEDRLKEFVEVSRKLLDSLPEHWHGEAESELRDLCDETHAVLAPHMHTPNEVEQATKRYGKPASPASPMEGWEPIETAPKDGTEIILFGLYPENDEGHPTLRVTAGFWCEPESPIIGDCGGECRCPEYGEPEPLFWCSTDGGFTTDWPPTHWKPLPAAPTGTASPSASEEGGE